jgi:biopolymer transport protein ExbD/biopolymer transport protein TolR
MGVANGVGTGIAVSEINITPLIDVLLVLLIIFMVIVPVTPKGLGAAIPQPPKSAAPADDAIVVSVLANGTGEPPYRINQSVISRSQIEPKLAEIFASRQQKTMFVRADESIAFSKVAEIVDMGHQADVANIGLLTPGIRQAQ